MTTINEKQYKKGASRILTNGSIEVITSINRKNGTYKSTIVNVEQNLYFLCGPNKKEKFLDETFTIIYQEEA